MQQILVQQVRREEPPCLAAIEDERRGLRSMEKEARQRDARADASRCEEDPAAGEEQGNCHPRNTGDIQRLGRVWTRRSRIGSGGWKTHFFRPSGHLL
jgi:hypothetical protein